MSTCRLQRVLGSLADGWEDFFETVPADFLEWPCRGEWLESEPITSGGVTSIVRLVWITSDDLEAVISVDDTECHDHPMGIYGLSHAIFIQADATVRPGWLTYAVTIPRMNILPGFRLTLEPCSSKQVA